VTRSALARAAVLLGLLGASACLRAPAAAPSSALARAPAAAVGVGPIAVSIPAGARVAETADELANWLADPAGPTEIWLRARRYQGDFKIARKLTLRGARGATLQGSGHGTVLEIEADAATVENLIIRHSGQRNTAEDAGIKAKGSGIRLRNLRVEDSLFGIVLAPCPRCEVERTYVQGPGDEVALKGDGIKLWESSDARVRDCVIDHVRDVVVWYSRRVLLDNNTVRNSRYGSHFMYAHDSIVRNSHVENNVVGIFVMYSSRLHVERNVLAGAHGAAGVGLGFKESDAVQVTGNWFVANTVGAYLDETPRSADVPVHFTDNTFALNDVALRLHGVRETLLFTHNDFRQNASLADVEGGGDALSTTFRRNRFSDYVGYDLDGDGVGDVAYQVKRLSGELVDAHPALSMFQGTVALDLIDAIASAVPVFANHLLLEDPEPAMSL
jgi:nitrous oxidase accessory protein